MTEGHVLIGIYLGYTGVGITKSQNSPDLCILLYAKYSSIKKTKRIRRKEVNAQVLTISVLKQLRGEEAALGASERGALHPRE